MKVAVLHTKESDESSKEVSKDLDEVGHIVKNALIKNGHDADTFNVNHDTFYKLKNSDIDCIFNVCERFNGKADMEPHVAAMLELLDIPYTGSDPFTLSLSLNKLKVKEILLQNGLYTPKYQLFTSDNQRLRSSLDFPLFVKPTSTHNSIGITNDSIVHNIDELRKRVRFVLDTLNQPALVEEYIDGQDVDAAILGNNSNAFALPLVYVDYEDLPENLNPIFCYEAKWKKSTTMYQKSNYVYYGDETDEKRLSPKTEKQVQSIALQAYKILGCRDYGRADIRIDKKNRPYFLEMNPNPGISKHDSMTFISKAIGLKHDQLINRILWYAMERCNKIDNYITKESKEKEQLLKPLIL